MAGDAVFRMSTRAHTPPTPVGRWCGRVLHVLSQKQVPLRSELGRASAVLGGLDSRDASWNAAVCVDLGARVQNCPSYGSALALPPHPPPGLPGQEHKKGHHGSGLVRCRFPGSSLVDFFFSSGDLNRLEGVSAVKKRAGFVGSILCLAASGLRIQEEGIIDGSIKVVIGQKQLITNPILGNTSTL